MTQSEIEFFLRDETKNCFSDIWYKNIAEKFSNKLNKVDSDFGYVYFIRVKHSDKVKIGSSKDIINRIFGFKTLLNDIVLDGFIYCKDFKEKEILLHKKLSKKTLSLEWFILSQLEAKDIIDEFGGIFINEYVDKKLVILDGLLLSCNENKLFSNDDEFNKYKILYLLIKQKITEYFLVNNNIKSFFIAPKDIQEFFINDEKITNKDIIKAMVIGKFIPLLKTKRYKFNNVIKVGRTFSLYRKDFIKNTDLQKQDTIVDNSNQVNVNIPEESTHPSPAEPFRLGQ